MQLNRFISITALWALAAGALAGQTGKAPTTHEKLSSEYFNGCWTLIDKTDRTPEDEENMILLAHASLWHWKQRPDCTPINKSVGYWLIARVYALTENPEMAAVYGQKCLKIGEANRLPPFYIGYAYEALARAEVLNKDWDEANGYLSKARNELENITDKDEAALLKADIAALEKRVPAGANN